MINLFSELRRLREENARLQAMIDELKDWPPEERLMAAYELGRRDERYARSYAVKVAGATIGTATTYAAARALAKQRGGVVCVSKGEK